MPAVFSSALPLGRLARSLAQSIQHTNSIVTPPCSQVGFLCAPAGCAVIGSARPAAIEHRVRPGRAQRARCVPAMTERRQFSRSLLFLCRPPRVVAVRVEDCRLRAHHGQRTRPCQGQQGDQAEVPPLWHPCFVSTTHTPRSSSPESNSLIMNLLLQDDPARNCRIRDGHRRGAFAHQRICGRRDRARGGRLRGSVRRRPVVPDPELLPADGGWSRNRYQHSDARESARTVDISRISNFRSSRYNIID